jgi:hypothetical protein
MLTAIPVAHEVEKGRVLEQPLGRRRGHCELCGQRHQRVRDPFYMGSSINSSGLVTSLVNEE